MTKEDIIMKKIGEGIIPNSSRKLPPFKKEWKHYLGIFLFLFSWLAFLIIRAIYPSSLFVGFFIILLGAFIGHAIARELQWLTIKNNLWFLSTKDFGQLLNDIINKTILPTIFKKIKPQTGYLKQKKKKRCLN